MSEQYLNYIVGPAGNDDLIYAKPVETFFICISCFNSVRTEISCGWGISEHIPAKSLNTSHICITRCAKCHVSMMARNANGRIKMIVPSNDPYAEPHELRISSKYQEIESMCTKTPELVCWSSNGNVRVAYVPITMIEMHHFLHSDVVRVNGDSDVIGVADMAFLVTSRYV